MLKIDAQRYTVEVSDTTTADESKKGGKIIKQ